MNVTKDKSKHRQPLKEGHLQKVFAEQREYAEACACQRIAETPTSSQTCRTPGCWKRFYTETTLTGRIRK